MPDGLTYRIVGTKQVDLKLEELVAKASGEFLALAAESAALIVVDAWKRLTPFKTGTYRGSIHIVVEEITPTSCLLWIGTDIVKPPYPIFLEYGTAHMSARPSATPAWEQAKPQMEREITAVLRRLLNL